MTATTNKSVNYWGVLPAAGVGSRMGSEIPKQYLKLGNCPVIEHTLNRLTSHPMITGVVVALSAEDDHYPYPKSFHGKSLTTVIGGAERCHSVLKALNYLITVADSEDWVLIHDAARPCLRHSDIDLLIGSLSEDAVGGLLGVPVSDTVKRSDERQRVTETVCREGLWRALTPQMFRLGRIVDALQSALEAGALVTDDASAMERMGWMPKMVVGHADNIKITHPYDLAQAELYLQQQE
ncbi:2-C-methyl-D-erythritol 4-phosphate cytidylyltransferase [Solemya pervernicosa gill symbiont]|uniref:2-C-methyl-D-erythritol 4-phosphate cytidylyltransferase n=2 Tax=Gammaproteobacteria incertae sedis TaxID=118884 RepID=A0A1T2L7Z1_9GAMM|nr:2-C-methyl-D-erythritol 4-phosphate cytidylyltransferase [Candidatus Reidiella endopervernicosa]OOZ41201.1 2-C-methyl-D-erythritol 4-phosphate cytidylyltransferase [Solemya pervernicosa gill symbiont]QKQ27073.1 2-C-methyl-D-erythritol 4-phosphate cytidylyltransferase [Candidatus Reidiella endopervernicosa]